MKRTSMKSWALCALVFLIPLFAHATGGDRVPGSRYVSGRGAALGDAYIGLADSVADGLFYNPAAIAKVNHFTVEPLNLQLQANSKLGATAGTNIYKFQSLNSYKSTLLNDPNTNPGAGMALLPNFGFRGFGFGMLYQSRLMAETDGTNIRYRSTYQLIPTVGFGLNLASGVLRIGYSLQWVNQASGDKTVSVNSSSLAWNEGLAEGKGFAHNFGLTLTLPYLYQPTISLVARNIGGLSLSGKPLIGLAKNSTGSIAEQELSVDGALGFVTKMGGGWQVSTQFAYRDALNSSATRALARMAAGLEFTAMDFLQMRAGYGSGYPTAGLGLKMKHGEANFAWYSEDLGDGVTPIRDIRYLFQIIFRVL